ncbi:hypothetical protein FB566_1051 [Stackebrandtia endophytica]|uniref:Lipoprotein n=1 Tax=Stackebrandtia endophytica TaxID=1496996 RepID=A0A543ASI4_9ACTN|nr:hypothetical protein [Stackebrandtia endophytica]TQL75544.1 hypothetical protein FB566_1051 [Stackebrandtia endophytica]
MLKNALNLFWAFLMLATSGCSMLFPSESFYAGGFAWIGDELYLYAPMCEGEELSGIEIYEVTRGPDGKASPVITNFWAVSGPTDFSVLNGSVSLGDDAAFSSVIAGDTHPSTWPDSMGMKVIFRDATDEYSNTLDFRKNKQVISLHNDEVVVPVYDVGSDPLEVHYLFDNPNGRSGYGLYSPGEIRDQMGCAKQYF